MRKYSFIILIIIFTTSGCFRGNVFVNKSRQDSNILIAQLEKTVAGNKAFYIHDRSIILKNIYIERHDIINNLYLHRDIYPGGWKILFNGVSKNEIEILKITTNADKYLIQKLESLPSKQEGCFIVFTPKYIYRLNYDQSKFIKYYRGKDPSLAFEKLDISQINPSIKKYFMLLSAELLLEKSKLLNQGNNLQRFGKYDFTMIMHTAITNTSTKGLPEDYQDYFKSLNKLTEKMKEEYSKYPKEEREDIGTVMNVEMKCNLLHETIVDKYPKITMRFNSFRSLIYFEEECYTSFGIEKKVAAYAKKLTDEGENDETVIRMKTMRAAAKFLQESAAHIKINKWWWS